MKHSMAKVLGTALFAAAVAASSVSAQTGTVIADALNVRTSPSLSGDIVDALYMGDQVTITYGVGDWYEIYHGGDCCYVNANYISSGSSSAAKSYDGGSSYDYDDGSSYSGSSYDYDDGDSYTDTSYDYDDGDSYTDTSYEDSGDSYSSSGTSGGTYLGNFTLTAYCPCAQCCGTANNPTASGVYPTAGHTVAMAGVPFGTQLLINGTVYTVEDRGTPYGHVDIFFNSHSEALAFGLQSADVYQLN